MQGIQKLGSSRFLSPSMLLMPVLELAPSSAFLTITGSYEHLLGEIISTTNVFIKTKKQHNTVSVTCREKYEKGENYKKEEDG
jgi:hypothetical protein